MISEEAGGGVTDRREAMARLLEAMDAGETTDVLLVSPGVFAQFVAFDKDGKPRERSAVALAFPHGQAPQEGT